MQKHFQILIVGGGNAGISLAAQLNLKQPKLNIAIIDPADKHYYQPAWTLVGGGAFDITKTVRNQSDVMPKFVTWIKERAGSFDPNNNIVETNLGKYTYDYLVLCPGIQLDWGKIKGLHGNVGKNGICSNYTYDNAPYTFECVQNIKPGQKAIFHAPGTPIKCGGAPQKIMYLACDYWKKKGYLKEVDVKFDTAGSIIFGVKKYADTLLKVVKRYGIKTNFFYNLVEIRPDSKEAIFEIMKDGKVVDTLVETYDMIHITPPQSAPDFIKNSPFAMDGNPLGWIDVDKHTLRHKKYSNVFGLGDATNTPNAKTGAAIRKQVPVVVDHLLAQIKGSSSEAYYNGYGSCPLVTGYGKLVLAEFDYDNNPLETFPFDQSKERWTMYQLKKQGLPWLYWNRILKGTA